MKVLRALLLLPLLSATAAFAAWPAFFNGAASQTDYPHWAMFDAGGNALVAGSAINVPGQKDVELIKYNPNGRALWIRTWDGSGQNDDVSAGVVDAEGNTYLAVTTQRSATDTDIAVLKFDSDGKKVWARTFDGEGQGSDGANAMSLDGNGNVAVVGYITRGGTGQDIEAAVYHANGDLAWKKSYSSPGSHVDVGSQCGFASDGSLYVSGNINQGGTPYRDLAVLKFSSTGVREWVRTYAGPGGFSDNPFGLVVTADDKVIVTGEASVTTGSDKDVVTLKYGPSGNRIWMALYNSGPAVNDTAIGLVLTPDGGVAVAGHSNPDMQSFDYLLIKYKANGTLDWVRNYDNFAGASADYAKAIGVDSSGNIYVAGVTQREAGSDQDMTTLKYSKTGNLLWVKTFAAPDNAPEMARAVAVDRVSRHVAVVGNTLTAASGSTDWVTVRY